jgi:uncharacterized Zn finger protein
VVAPGRVDAHVAGSELYEVSIDIKRLDRKVWERIARESSGQISSLIELLSGKLSASVMRIITRPEDGLFPKPREVGFRCSCPDFAHMCKHIAATLYGVGARLDERPELLFTLRGVDHMELVAAAGDVGRIVEGGARGAHETIDAADVADVFGIELAAPVEPPAASKSSKKCAKSKRKK